MQTAIQSKPEEEQLSWEALVSEWIDAEGEIRPEDLDSPYGRQLWDTYHLIGDVLRNEDLAIKPGPLFYARVSKAIDAEPSIVAPRLGKRASARIGLSGLVVAAAVVSVVWIALPYLSQTDTAPSSTQVVASANGAIDANDAGDANGLVDYLDAHRQIAGAGPIRQVSFDAGISK